MDREPTTGNTQNVCENQCYKDQPHQRTERRWYRKRYPTITQLQLEIPLPRSTSKGSSRLAAAGFQLIESEDQPGGTDVEKPQVNGPRSTSKGSTRLVEEMPTPGPCSQIIPNRTLMPDTGIIYFETMWIFLQLEIPMRVE